MSAISTRSRYRVAGVLAFLIIWELACRLGLLDERFFAPPSDALVAIFRLVTSGEIFKFAVPTLTRLAIAMAVSLVCGGVVGLLVGLVPPLDWLTQPLVSVFFPIPKIAFLPVLLFIFGRSEFTYMLIIFLTAFFQVLIGTRASVKQVDKQMLEAARVFGVSRVGLLVKVVLPACLPGVLVVTRVAIGLCVIAVAAVEFIAARSGLGYLVSKSWETLQVDRMYGGIILIGSLGLALTSAVAWVERRYSNPEFRESAGPARRALSGARSSASVLRSEPALSPHDDHTAELVGTTQPRGEAR